MYAFDLQHMTFNYQMFIVYVSNFLYNFKNLTYHHHIVVDFSGHLGKKIKILKNGGGEENQVVRNFRTPLI